MRKSLVIVGGGTAGWLTAAYLAKVLRAGEADGVAVTVIESPDIAPIGVGEGTFPTIRRTLGIIGLNEADFIRASSATFKQGVVFNDWGTLGTGYFHPFNFPHEGEAGDLAPYWLMRRAAGDTMPFADAVSQQGHIVRAGHAPKRLSDGDYRGPMNYAYHFDAARFAEVLKARALQLGVRHIAAEVTAVTRDDHDGIASVRALDEDIAGDLFIDCTGFRARLIGDALGSPFHACDDVLFNDRALAIQVPYATPDAATLPATLATAHEAGWTWDIGLDSRRGIGYVFSSRYSSDDRAEQVLRAYVGPQGDALNVRLLKFRTGYRERQWIGNCIAVGLSAGFFEPLESTGIMLIEIAATVIGDVFPCRRETMAASARAYNHMMSERFSRIVDFLKLHYALSRRDEPYWRANSDPSSWPQRLRDSIAQWRERPTSRFDFAVDYETFLPASYQYILYGLGIEVDMTGHAGRFNDHAAARKAFDAVALAGPEALKHLPRHRDYLKARG